MQLSLRSKKKTVSKYDLLKDKEGNQEIAASGGHAILTSVHVAVTAALSK